MFKIFGRIGTLAGFAALAACNHTGGVSVSVPPSLPSSISASLQVQTTDYAGTGNISQETVTVDITATGNTVNGAPEYVIDYKGTPVTVQWDSSYQAYVGVNGNISIIFAPGVITANGELVLAVVGILDASGINGASYGPVVAGIETDPTVVGGLTGTASYTGWAFASLAAEDDSFWSAAEGDVTMNIDFDTDMIDGAINLVDCGCGYGGVTIANTTMTLNPMPITGNSFSGTATITAADFGMSSVGTLTVGGKFYETNGTAVGGYVSGVGTATGSGVNSLLDLAFIAN